MPPIPTAATRSFPLGGVWPAPPKTWRGTIDAAASPAALISREPIGWVYFALLLAACPLVLLLGMLGGEIVFPKKRK